MTSDKIPKVFTIHLPIKILLLRNCFWTRMQLFPVDNCCEYSSFIILIADRKHFDTIPLWERGELSRKQPVDVSVDLYWDKS